MSILSTLLRRRSKMMERIIDLEVHVHHLERLVKVGTQRLDLHATKINALQDDLENEKEAS